MPMQPLTPEIIAKSLEELENDYWGEPDAQSSLVVKCQRLRRVPLKDLGVEELRLLIGQKIGLDYLVPLAVDILASDPWVGGDYFDGDLLKNLLELERNYWASRPEFKSRMDQVVENAVAVLLASAPDETDWYDDGVVRKLELLTSRDLVRKGGRSALSSP